MRRTSRSSATSRGYRLPMINRLDHEVEADLAGRLLLARQRAERLAQLDGSVARKDIDELLRSLDAWGCAATDRVVDGRPGAASVRSDRGRRRAGDVCGSDVGGAGEAHAGATGGGSMRGLVELPHTAAAILAFAGIDFSRQPKSAAPVKTGGVAKTASHGRPLVGEPHGCAGSACVEPGARNIHGI